MNPAMKTLISALRKTDVKDDAQARSAFREYCWQNMVVPIRINKYVEPSLEMVMASRFVYPGLSMAYAEVAAQKGASDEEVAAVFYDTLDEEGISFRVMKEDERPSFGEIVRAMDIDGQMEVAKFFGIRPVALAVAGKKK